MKVVIIEVDDRAGSDYQSLSSKGKLKFNKEVAKLLRDKVREERSTEIKKILDEIHNEPLDAVQRDLLVQILSLEALEG